MKKSALLNILAVLILGLCAYLNSLNGEFIWDDIHLVKNNAFIKSPPQIRNIFTQDIGAGSSLKYNFYRPLQIFSYAIDHFFWGDNVFGYHIASMLWHILAAMCIYWLVLLLFGDGLLSLLTSSMFVIHPIHTEAVSYISGRADILSAVFLVLAFIFYVKTERSDNLKFYFVSFLLFILALLSKENAVIFPLLILIYHYAFQKRIKMAFLLPYLIILPLYFFVRFYFLGICPSDLPPVNLFARLPGFFVALYNYLRLLIFPADLHFEYGYKFFRFTDYRCIIGISIMVLLMSYAFIKRNKQKLVFFAVAWFFVNLLPQSNILPTNYSFMMEHWLYLPSLGFFLVFASIQERLLKNNRWRNFSILFIILLCSFYLYATIKQNRYWNNQIFFYKKTLQYAPESPRIYNNLCNAYINYSMYKEAIPLCRKAIELYPLCVDAYLNLGQAYKDTGDVENAINSYERALQISPRNKKAQGGLKLLRQ